ncbi:MAG TPA: hypothetical protein VG796_24685 [Verrucomicrobiales bacterium]|nr:hypothetical protein [Verrucomicrobiales bacterium]
MKMMLRMIPAIAGFAAMHAKGATLSYLSASRSLQGEESVAVPDTEFADFDASVVGIFLDPNTGPRPGCRAAQRSTLGGEAITVASTISGDAARGVSLFHIVFHLDATAAYALSGSMHLLGTSGFACVSFRNVAQPDESIINEILFAPPQISEMRPLLFTGSLEAGDYLLEAMIYGGGDNRPTEGSLDVLFTIPEPRSALLAGTGLALWCRFRTRRAGG